MNVDGRSTHRLRLNANRSIHEPDSLLHACETQRSALLCYLDVKPFAKENLQPIGTPLLGETPGYVNGKVRD